MRGTAARAALIALGLSSVYAATAVADTLSPFRIFEGKTTTVTKSGAAQPIQLSVQSWDMSGPSGTTHEIPLRGFYVAHLLSGAISTTIDGQTTTQPPGAYWPVKAGATMQVKVLGEFAVLETITVSKQ